MDSGIAKAYAVIANKLCEKSGVNVELYRLFDAVRKGAIKMRGQGFNFAKIRDQVFAQLATTIAGDMDRLWAGDWDIDTIVLTGGGCQDLAPHLQPLITGNIRTAPERDDPRLANVEGYLKYGRYLWDRGQEQEQKPESESEPEPENA